MAASTFITTKESASCCTSINVSEFTYEWIIERFKLLLKENGQSIQSPIFGTINTNVEWQLSLYPEGYTKVDAGYVSIYLHCCEKAVKAKTKANVEISLPRFGKTHTFVHQCANTGGYGYARIMLRSTLLDLCGSNDTFTIRCKIQVPCEIITKTVNTVQPLEQVCDSQAGQWNHDFHLLLKESKFSDVVLIVGTQSFPAHKLVLAARSPVFSAMFEHDETQEDLESQVKIENMEPAKKKQNFENQVKIDNMEPAVVEAMLEFCYTDQVKNLEELAYGLFEAAGKYDMPGLRIMCEKALSNALTKDNAAAILVLAKRHNADKLKDRVMDFMDDHFSGVVQTESYQNIDDPELLRQFILLIQSRRR